MYRKLQALLTVDTLAFPLHWKWEFFTLSSWMCDTERQWMQHVRHLTKFTACTSWIGKVQQFSRSRIENNSGTTSPTSSSSSIRNKQLSVVTIKLFCVLQCCWSFDFSSLSSLKPNLYYCSIMKIKPSGTQLFFLCPTFWTTSRWLVCVGRSDDVTTLLGEVCATLFVLRLKKVYQL